MRVCVCVCVWVCVRACVWACVCGPVCMCVCFTLIFLQGKLPFNKAKSILTKVTTATEAEAKALATYFPSGKARPKFDVSRTCVAAKNKKDTAVKGVQRPTTVSVVMMKEYCPITPKNKARRILLSEGRILSIKVTRGMSSREIKNLIVRAFQIPEYTVLECDDTGHNLLRRIDQSIDGNDVLNLRGALYLCEVFKVQRIFNHASLTC